jgi:RNA polymerase sigma-70 factor (ECF subfamily)
MAALTPVEGGKGRLFLTTNWTQAIAAGRGDSQAQVALAGLCEAYWYPLYAFVRRKGYSPEDAQDLTQEFFARLVEKNWLADLKREGGKFRSFLLRALDRFLVDEWRKNRAQKRGGGNVVSLDAGEAETRYLREPSHEQTPEKLFEQNCAMAVLERVYRELEAEYSERADLFETLKPCLVGDRTALPYAEIAAELNLTEAGVKTLVHRMRQRFRALLRETVAQTVSRPKEVEEELREMLRALSGGNA